MSTEDRRGSNPDREGVSAALARAAEKARRLAEQTGTPFVVRRPVAGPPPVDATAPTAPAAGGQVAPPAGPTGGLRIAR